MSTPKPPGATTRNGYGRPHQVLRAKWAPIVAAGHTICWRCRTRILPNQKWHLGHDDDRRYYRGPEHVRCSCTSKPPLASPAKALDFFRIRH